MNICLRKDYKHEKCIIIHPNDKKNLCACNMKNKNKNNRITDNKKITKTSNKTRMVRKFPEFGKGKKEAEKFVISVLFYLFHFVCFRKKKLFHSKIVCCCCYSVWWVYLIEINTSVSIRWRDVKQNNNNKKQHAHQDTMDTMNLIFVKIHLFTYWIIDAFFAFVCLFFYYS